MATEEDRKYNIDAWARLFKAETWEALKKLAEDSVYIREAAKTMYVMSEDEEVRELMIRKKEFEADQRWLHNHVKEMEQRIVEKDQRLAEKDLEIAELKSKLRELEGK